MHSYALNHKSHGFSLIEILLVLGLIGSMAVAAFLLYPRMMLAQDVSKAEQKYIAITGAAREYFGDSPYVGISNAMMVSAGVAETSDLVSPWGLIDLQPSSSGDGFRVDFHDVPREACQRLVARLELFSAEISAGTTPIKSSTTAYNSITAPGACGITQIVSFSPG